MTWIIANIKAALIFSAILIAVCGVGLAYILWIKSEHTKDLQRQKDQITQECKQAQAKTEKADAKFKADYDDLKRRHDALLLQHPAECVHPSSSTNNPNGGNGHAGPDVSSAWLLDYATECEGYRRSVVTLGQFIEDERK